MPELLRLRREVARANGQITSGTCSGTGGWRRSPTRRSTNSETPSCRVGACDGQHPGRLVDADHVDRRQPRWARRSGPYPRRARRLGRRSGPLPRRRSRVLRDRAAPRVVDVRDRVVERHGRIQALSRRPISLQSLDGLEAYERDALSVVAPRVGSRARRCEGSRCRAGRASWRSRCARRRPGRGMLLNGVRQRIEEAVEGVGQRAGSRRAGTTPRGREDRRHASGRGGRRPPAPDHPDAGLIEEAFLGLGYHVRDDREVETTECALYAAFDPWHPACSHRATFFLDDRTVLRTETSPSQIHELEEREPPLYMVSIGRCYRRRDAIDAT